MNDKPATKLSQAELDRQKINFIQKLIDIRRKQKNREAEKNSNDNNR